jgi:hypothetical protein
MANYQYVKACNKCDVPTLDPTYIGSAGCEIDLNQSIAPVAVGWISCTDLGNLQSTNKNATLGAGNDGTVAALLEAIYAANGLEITPLKVVAFDPRPIEKTIAAVGFGENRREEETRTVGHKPLVTFRGSWQADSLANSVLTQNLPANTDINQFFGNKVGTTQSTYAQEKEFFLYMLKNRWTPFFIRGNSQFGYIIDIPQDFNLNFLQPVMNIKRIEVAENDDVYPAYELSLNYGHNTVIDLEKKEYCILDYASAPDLINAINAVLI